MQKIKVLSKDIDNGSENINLRISLAGGGREKLNEYMVIAETENDVSVIRAGEDINLANLLFRLFFENDVLPETVDDIVRDMMLEKCMQLL